MVMNIPYYKFRIIYFAQAGNLLSQALVTGEKVAGIDLDSDVLEFFACAIGEDSLGESLKLCKGVDHAAAEEGGAIFKRGFIDDYGCPFCFDAFHHALY